MLSFVYENELDKYYLRIGWYKIVNKETILIKFPSVKLSAYAGSNQAVAR